MKLFCEINEFENILKNNGRTYFECETDECERDELKNVIILVELDVEDNVVNFSGYIKFEEIKSVFGN